MIESGPVYLSIVVPVYDEAPNLSWLFSGLSASLNAIGKPYEIIFVDDGSRDGSLDVLTSLRRKRPDRVKIVELTRNFGQHAALLAGFREASGEVIVTLDADLQDPPAEISKLVDAIERGHDVVGGYRTRHHHPWWRQAASRVLNALRARVTFLEMRDHACMLRAYRREIVATILHGNETITFIPALAMLYATNPTEVEVAHAPRAHGKSKYGLYRLVRMNFDLITSFSATAPQLFTFSGVLVSSFSAILVVAMAARRLAVGPEAQGVFILIGILFFLVGVCITGLGIVGEYVARIEHEVRRRPPYVVKQVHGSSKPSPHA